MILVLFGALLEDAKKFATHLTPVISCVRSPSIISLARWKMENVYMYINKIIRTPRESRITSLVASRKGQYGMVELRLGKSSSPSASALMTGLSHQLKTTLCSMPAREYQSERRTSLRVQIYRPEIDLKCTLNKGFIRVREPPLDRVSPSQVGMVQ